MNVSEFQKAGLAVRSEVDVLVVGGGTAGAVAGIAAARAGASTLVVEELGFLGGTQTGALVTPQMPNVIAGEALNGGIDLEIHRRLASLNASGTWKDGNPGWFDPELLKLLLDDMLDEAGGSALHFARFEDVIIDGTAVTGAIVGSRFGRWAIRARRIIDATGDGEVAVKAGVPFELGDPKTARNQPLSVRFHIGNVDLEAFGAYLESLGPADVVRSAPGTLVPLIHTAMVWGGGWPLEAVFNKAVAAGVLWPADGNYFQVFTMAGRPGELAFNCPRISDRCDGTDVEHLSAAMRAGRRAIRRYVEFCRRYLPGCAQGYLVLSAPMVGVRETRRIMGEYLLTAEDVLGARTFADAVARSNYPIDIHRDPGEEGGGLRHLASGTFYEIPYRCLIPRGVDNLLTAGRCLSASFAAQGSVRIQSNCRALGEAAGLAAALSLQQGVTPRALDGAALRQELKSRGGHL